MDDMKALFEKMRAKMDMVRSVFGEENLAAVPFCCFCFYCALVDILYCSIAMCIRETMRL